MTEQPKTSAACGPQPKFWRFIPEMLLILLPLTWLSARILPNGANRQRQAVEAIERNGGTVRYDYQRLAGTVEPGYGFQLKPPGPLPLRWLLGKHYFMSVTYIRIGRNSESCLAQLRGLPDIEHALLDGGVDRDLENFKQLRKLRYLSLKGYTVSASDHSPFRVLQYLPNLETLNLQNSQFGDDDAEHLRNAAKLKRLVLCGTAIRDEGLACLQNLDSLDFLDLSSTKVTDRGVMYLSDLPKLTSLRLDHTGVSDSSSESFTKMKSLRELSLFEADVEGIGRLRRGLPMCTIHYSKRKPPLDVERERP